MSLIILFVICLYLAVLIGATILGYRYGNKRAWSRGKRWAGAAVGFLIISLPVFWDWLPTVWLHDYYCDKYGGLVVSKTPEKWGQENPGMFDTSTSQKNSPQISTPTGYYYDLNQRIRWEIRHEEIPFWLRRNETRLTDTKTGEILARYIDFSTGQSGNSINEFRDAKIWMKRFSCEPEGKMVRREEFNEITSKFQSSRRQK